MRDMKKFADALKQRYTNKSVKNVTMSVKNPKKEKEKREEKVKSSFQNLEFIRSKKAKSGMPDHIRQKSMRRILKKIKENSK